MTNMRVLLRDPRTKLYWAGPGDWVFDPETAFDFEKLEAADRVCKSQNLPGLEIRLAMGDAVCAVPIATQLAA